MTEPEPVNPAVQKWRARYMRVKAISILSMIGCMSYMLLWSSSRNDIAFIWLGLTMLFSFGGAQWCQWQIRRLDDEEDDE